MTAGSQPSYLDFASDVQPLSRLRKLVNRGDGVVLGATKDTINSLIDAIEAQVGSVVTVAGTRLDLAAINVSTLPTGARGCASNSANTSYWTLGPRNGATIDNIFVMSATDTQGRVWNRTIAPQRSDVQKATWYIDSSLGSNLSSGDTGSPIGTLREWFARTGGWYAQNTTLNLSNTSNVWPTSDAFTYAPTPVPDQAGSAPVDGGYSFSVVGARKVVRSGTFTSAGVQGAFNAGTKATATDTNALGGADVGNLIVITSGASSGSMAWALRNLGSGVMMTSYWVTQTGSGISVNGSAPTNGATYNVVSMMQLVIPHPEVSGAGLFNVVNIQPTNAGPNYRNAVSSNSLRTYYISCYFDFLAFVDNEVGEMTGGNFWNCCLDAAVRPKSGNYWVQHGGWTGAFGGGWWPCSAAMVSLTLVAGASSLYAGGAVNTGEFGGFLYLNASAVWPTNPSAISLGAGRGAQVTIFGFGGSDGAVGLQIRDRATVFVFYAITPTVTGTTEIEFVTSTVIPELPTAGGAVPAAATCNTWTTWGNGTFNRRAVHQKDAAAILTAVSV